LFTLDEDTADIETAWRLQSLRAKGQSIPSGCRDPRMLQYAEVGRMGARLSDLIEVVGRGRVKVIVLDDFASTPIPIYREVLGFLGLDYDERTEFGGVNVTKTYRSHSLQLLLMRPKLSQRLVGPMVGPSQRSFIGRALKRLKKANIIRRPWQPISAAFRQ